MRFSANLGVLWADLPLPDAIRAAARAGFDAVECHWPYATHADAVAQALRETGLPMLGINTARGAQTGDFGLCALPHRRDEARAAIRQAVDYAAQINARNIHVMAGIAQGAQAEACFKDNLTLACDLAAPEGITVLIEPINTRDVPGYFLSDTDHAARLIHDLSRPNLRLMFDCYHVGRMQQDVVAQLRQHRDIIGHIQIAAVPDRGAPDRGRLEYRQVMRCLCDLGYDGPIGAEYKPDGVTEDSLHWMQVLRAIGAKP